MVIHLHDHLALLAVDHELIRTGQARAVEQGVNRKGGVIRPGGFKPERGEIRELFRRIGKGIDRHAACRQTILIRAVHRTEIARAEERDDIAARQFRGFEGAEPGKTEIALPF